MPIARIRRLNHKLFKDKQLFDAEQTTQLPLRIALLELLLYSDREGRFRWQPEHLKMATLPWDDVNMLEILDALIGYDYIKQYEHQGQYYGFIVSFKDYFKLRLCDPPINK